MVEFDDHVGSASPNIHGHHLESNGLLSLLAESAMRGSLEVDGQVLSTDGEYPTNIVIENN